MSSVHLQRVSRSFGASAVLSEVELEIASGELFFLLGPSGGGKTTLLRLIAGLDRPSAGRVLLDGQDVTDLPPHRRAIGLVFQNHALWPHLTVAQNVAFGLEAAGVSKATVRPQVDKALRSVHLDNFHGRAIRSLSGGEQQRVALARALVRRPRCLLLDEPLSSLDAPLRQELQTLIVQICRRESLTVICVTHDPQEAFLADRVGILEGGRLTQSGRPSEILAS